ncbi:MAG: Gfo/Idh/MocA family oxidoreductase [Planctomycetes bacterium]|nr:Gfo/Idh/MocA family oxidoreductase [Planctomycetota bacterium]
MPERDSKTGGLSRRDFLVSTAAAAGASMLLPRAVRAEGPRGHGGEICVALIGAGTQGREVLMVNTLKIPGVRFQAVCDIWPYHQTYASRMLARYGHPVQVYADYREMLDQEKGLDAALVATPEWMHAEHTIACLRAGLHVYCEKEMSNDLGQARAMVEAARETGRLLQIGHQRRSNPRYRHAREKLLGEAKLLGRITHVYGQWNRAVKEDLGWPEKHAMAAAYLQKYGYADMHQFRNWRNYRKLGGGPIVDLGSHQIDIFHWFLGVRPRSVMASGGIDYYRHHEWYDNVMAIYEYDTPGGVARAYYQVLTTTSARGYHETFLGDEGTLQISEDPAKIRVYAEGRIDSDAKWRPWVKKGYLVKSEPTTEEKPRPKDDVLAVYESEPVATWLMPLRADEPFHLPHLQNFFAAVRGEAKLACPAEVGYETAVAVLRVNEAVAAGKRLAFEDEDFRA